MTKRTTFSLIDENDAYLRQLGGNMSDTVNDLITKLRTGQVAPAEKKEEGAADMNCIFNMPALVGGEISFACPVKGHYPNLAKPDKMDDLLTACRRCPRHMEHSARIKRQMLNPKNTGMDALDDAEKQAQADTTIVCDTCGLELNLKDFLQFGKPLTAMRNEMLRHVENRHSRKFLQPEEFPAQLVARAAKE